MFIEIKNLPNFNKTILIHLMSKLCADKQNDTATAAPFVPTWDAWNRLVCVQGGPNRLQTAP